MAVSTAYIDETPYSPGCSGHLVNDLGSRHVPWARWWRLRPFRRPGGEQAAVERLGDGGGAVADVELGVDVQQVGLDRGLADEQPGGCLPVGGPGRNQLQDLQLTLAERLGAGRPD